MIVHLRQKYRFANCRADMPELIYIVTYITSYFIPELLILQMAVCFPIMATNALDRLRDWFYPLFRKRESIKLVVS